MGSFPKDLFLLIIIQLMSVKAFSQTYPVSASVQLSPPYSIYLADYVAPGSEQLKLHLLLKDLNQPFYDARLHMRIEGTGVVIENIPLINISPFTMEAGIPLTLSASDLSPYFNINNLSFSGITKNEFAKSGRLPEGFYRICFTVVDHRRQDVTVSNAGCASIWIIQNDPPRINLPICGSDITLTDPQSIIFQWTPLHAASPNAANTTEYEFTLVEVRPEGRNPNDAINTSLPLYRERTMFPNLYYGPADPVMIPGQRYAFRVRAIDGMGRDLFKNNGYSEVCTFTFGKDVTLEPPANIKCAAEAERRARLSWDAQPNPTGYELAYRKKGEGYDWFYATTADIETVINDLDPESSYEARVTSLMSSYRSTPSEIITFTTPGRPEFSCGEVPEGIGPVEVKPLPSARAGNIFKVGEFELQVLKIEGGDGIFSGLGSMFIPYLGININCRFQNISVNINQQVVQGEVVAITEGMEGLFERWEQPEEQAEDEETNDEIPQQPEPIAGEDITVEGIIKDIVANMQDSTITITKEDGTTEEYGLQTAENNESGGKRFTDEQGNVWVVDREGGVKKLESGGEEIKPPGATPDSLQYMVKFEQDEDGKYGFDEYDDEKVALTSHYKTANINLELNYTSWKAVEAGRQDNILAKELLSRDENFPALVAFKTSGVQPTVYELQDKSHKQIIITGKSHGSEDELYAFIIRKDTAGNEAEEMVGAVNVISYDKIKEKVILVPVNNAAIPNLASVTQQLNSIYGAAVAEWEVAIDDPFEINEDELKGWDDDESGIFASFPHKMRQFNRKFEGSRKNIEKEAYYLFLIDGNYSSRSGFMPFKRKFGYIYLNNTTNISKIIAHELGHGAFRLRHTFSEYPALSKGTTKNLMDYTPNGTELYKYQWDFIHDPENMIGWFEEDEEGGMISKNHADQVSINIDEFNARFAPGLGNLKLKYSLNDTAMNLISLYHDEEFWVQFFIFDRNKKLIYTDKKSPKKSDGFSFDGFISEPKEAISYDKGPYQVTANIIGGKDLSGISDVSNWSELKDYIYEQYNKDSVNFVSVQQDTIFNIDLDALDFVTYKEEYAGVMNNKVKINYMQFLDNFRKDGYFTDGKSPLKWMEENGISENSITFLGMTITRLTNVFKEVLIETEEILKTDYPEAYTEILNQYTGSANAQSEIRYIQNACMCNPSNHSLGCAIDIRVAYNPQITSENIEYVNFIKYITGLDLTKRKSAKEVTEAQNIFMKKLHGENYLMNKRTVTEILSDYELINNFDSKAPFSLYTFLNLHFGDVVLNNFQKFKNDVIKVLEAHKNRMIFEASTQQAIDVLITHLEKTDSDTIMGRYIAHLEKFREEKDAFINGIKGGEIINLSDFILFFSDRRKRLYGNVLLENGFGDSRLELINSFNEAHKRISKKYLNQIIDAEWGGTYQSKYDGMHFGMSSAFIKKLTNQNE